MATRSLIACANDDRTFTALYCHWSGYLEWNGAILSRFFATPDRVQALLDMGNLSELGAKLGDGPQDTSPDGRAFSDPAESTCLFYGRDLGVRWSEASHYADEAELLCQAESCFASYVYVYQRGAWYVRSGRHPDWTDVTTAMTADRAERAALAF